MNRPFRWSLPGRRRWLVGFIAGLCGLWVLPLEPAAPDGPPVPWAASAGMAAPGSSAGGQGPAKVRGSAALDRISRLLQAHRRTRTRKRFDDLVLHPETAPATRDLRSRQDARAAGAGAPPIVKAVSIALLSWEMAYRAARSGVLHAHASTCPPPVRT